jgi:hypothetical protein
MHLQTKNTNMKKTLLFSLLLITSQVFSQIKYSINNELSNTSFVQKNSGPRIGLTFITGGELTEKLAAEFGVSTNMISQFGYQFEKQIIGDENIAGIIEGIVFIGGLEQGMFLPSVSGLFGLRHNSGLEFAIGPNLSLSGASLVIGLGKSFELGNLNIPINFAWVPSHSRIESSEFQQFDIDTGLSIVNESDELIKSGQRFTFTVGFNMKKY